MKLLTLILGASLKPERHSHRTIVSLLENGFPVTAIGKAEGYVMDVPILTGFPALQRVHTVSMYLNPVQQGPYEDYILSLNPKRIIFNKKTYNPALAWKARQKGIMVSESCTLVMLVKGTYEGD